VARSLAEVFPFFLRLRLEAQLEARKDDPPMDHRIGLAELSHFERRQLREAFILIEQTQAELRAVWRLDRLG
jgi:signal-transduction protein with cAMP-binding, CBS, and nucleotidyltransferase domain